MTAEDLAELVEPLIAGIVEDPLWSAFLARLRVRLRADYVSIVFRPLPDGAPQNRLIHLYAGQAWPPEVTRAFREGLRGNDPMPYHDLVAGRVYALPELLRFGDPEHDRYRLQFLAPGGMRVMRMMRVEEPGGVSAWLTASRAQDDFDGADAALIAAIAPFWRAALHTYVALERERMTGSVAKEAIRRMNFGWLTLDGEGKVLDADAHGAATLAASTMLVTGRSGRLTARTPEVAKEIAGAVKALTRDPHARPRAIVLNRDPWFDMLLVGSSIRTGTTRPAPALVAYVHADDWSSADRCEQLGELFDLIPSEARLALALSRGMSIAQAAGELGLTVESARTYSKRIYAKTGARGQADLVRFIHRSVLAIA
ncbi:MAG: helix-turn-helix transcriptional regulator [Novosphingobium sp.]|jgi:DNA-binding CsgD family transcriptional regulator|nr:helix-turn-helix transcriptional regulator [Novosphingobium sp.]